MTDIIGNIMWISLCVAMLIHSFLMIKRARKWGERREEDQALYEAMTDTELAKEWYRPSHTAKPTWRHLEQLQALNMICAGRFARVEALKGGVLDDRGF